MPLVSCRVSPTASSYQYVPMQADPAHKIGALCCIDSIAQNIGEPYVSYFSNSIAKVRCAGVVDLTG
jgi:hypothetical protein